MFYRKTGNRVVSRLIKQINRVGSRKESESGKKQKKKK